jgi:hypothetical protein
MPLFSKHITKSSFLQFGDKVLFFLLRSIAYYVLPIQCFIEYLSVIVEENVIYYQVDECKGVSGLSFSFLAENTSLDRNNSRTVRH